jgi:hypothetical protein
MFTPLLEAIWGKPKTPTEVLAEIAKSALAAERVMSREAGRAEKASLKAIVEAENWLASGREFDAIERIVRARYLIGEQAQDRADRFHAQASLLRDFATNASVMSSATDLMRAQLRSAAVFGRIARMLPNSAELMRLSKAFELSKMRQEEIRSELGGGMKDGALDLYEEADEGEAAKRISPERRVEQRMMRLRGEDVDQELAALPSVLRPPGQRGSGPVAVAASAPRAPPSDSEGDDEGS